MGHLADASTIPLWVSLGVSSIFFLVFIVAWIWFIVKRRGQSESLEDKKSHNRARAYVPVFQASAALFVTAILVVMNVCLILQQTEFVRSDDTSVVWGRWAFYIPLFFAMSWMVTLYLSRMSDQAGNMQEGSYVGLVATWFSAFGATALLLATISSNNNIWFWFSVTALLWLVTIVLFCLCYVWGTKQHLPSWLAGLMITLITFAYLIFLVIWAIGKSGGNVGGFTFAAERWLYFTAEFLIIIYITVIVFTEGKEVSSEFSMTYMKQQLSKLYGSHRKPTVNSHRRA